MQFQVSAGGRPSVLVELFTDPDGFFERVAAEGGLVPPGAVVLVLGVVGAVSAFPVLRATAGALPEGVRAIAIVTYVMGLGGAVVGPFVVWALYAGAFHVISSLLYDVDGSFERTLVVTGWGFVPAIFGALISGALTFVVLQSLTFPTDPTQAAGFARRLRHDPLLRLASGLGVVFLLWQGFLWTFAVRHARGLDVREAAITVAGPVGIGLLFRLYGLV